VVPPTLKLLPRQPRNLAAVVILPDQLRKIVAAAVPKLTPNALPQKNPLLSRTLAVIMAMEASVALQLLLPKRVAVTAVLRKIQKRAPL